MDGIVCKLLVDHRLGLTRKVHRRMGHLTPSTDFLQLNLQVQAIHGRAVRSRSLSECCQNTR